MTKPTACNRRPDCRLTPLLGLLLLVVLFVGGAHHHADGGRHVCAVCTVGHSTAVAADVAAPTAAPAGPARAIHAPTQRAPRQTRLETASSRAPPQA